MTDTPNLDELRQQIDDIDVQIHQLINQRATCAEQVADTKLKAFVAENGDSDVSKVTFYRP